MARISKEYTLQYGILLVMVIITIAVLGVTLVGYNHYKVYAQEKSGEAELAEAKYSKLVAVETAKAANESATYMAQAHITEARGVAAANAIIADSITPEYIEYIYIQGLQDNTNKVIYIPTETGIPIIEAGRLTHTEE